MSLAKEHGLQPILDLCHVWAQNHAQEAIDLLFNKSLKRKAADMADIQKKFKTKSHQECTLPELRRRCRERNISVTRLNKDVLINRLVESDSK